MRKPSATALLTAAALGAFVSVGTAASAATFAGPFVGDTVTYSDVQDQDDLFGAPTVSGDSLSFTPQGFSVRNQNGENGGRTFLDGFLSTLIESNDGEAITGFTLTESGAARMFDNAAGTGTDFTRVNVYTFFSLTVLEVDGSPVNGTILTQDNLLYESRLATDGEIAEAWSGTASVNVAALAAGKGIRGDITRLRLTLDNELTAQSEDGTLAFIDKKGVSGVTITVPEPTSALLVLGGGALLLRRRMAS